MKDIIKENYKKYNYNNIDEDAEVIKNWEPLRFKLNDNYKYVSKNIIFNTLSNILCFIVALILTLVNKIFFGYKVINKNHIPKDTGFVSISNHIHIIDCGFIGTTLYPRRIYFPTRAESFKIPLVRHIIKILYAVPIPKEDKYKKKFYKQINEVLQKGKIVHMYPEGSLWPYYDKIRDFKFGAFKIAVEANVPILPIRFKYKKVWYKRKPAIICEILEPLYPNNKLEKDERIRDLRERALNEMRKEHESTNTIL